MNKSTKIDYNLHVSDDTLILRDESLINGRKYMPSLIFQPRSVYIMQCNRIVYIGSKAGATSFIERNEGKFCKDIRIGRPHR
jgi:hypothetical protein